MQARDPPHCPRMGRLRAIQNDGERASNVPEIAWSGRSFRLPHLFALVVNTPQHAVGKAVTQLSLLELSQPR